MKEVNEAYAVLSDPEKASGLRPTGQPLAAGTGFSGSAGWDAGFEFSGDGAHSGGAADFSDFFASLFGRAGRDRGAGDFQMRGGDHHARILIGLADAYHGATRTITLRAAKQDASGHVITEERALMCRSQGCKEGQHIALAGQGSPGMGRGSAGDLYLEVQFSPIRASRRRRMCTSQSGGPVGATLGATIESTTPSGNVQVKVPAGSQAGASCA